MSAAARKVLVLGGPDAGKTTLLVQLHGRVSSGNGSLRARGAPASLAPIEDGYRRLQQGLPVAHTGHGTSVTLDLPAVDAAGRHIDIVVPDYAGEDLRRMIVERRVPDLWRSEASSGDLWLLLIRLAKHAILPDVLTRPIGSLACAAVDDPPGEPDALPVDMWAVELLQALLYSRHQEGRTLLPALTLVLSCWDELNEPAGTRPADLAAQSLALLDSFCRSKWANQYRVVGLSAQGRPLTEATPAEEYLDHGPQQMGWIVTGDGGRDSDLTLLASCA